MGCAGPRKHDSWVREVRRVRRVLQVRGSEPREPTEPTEPSEPRVCILCAGRHSGEESRRQNMRGMSKRNLFVGATFVAVLATLGVAQSVLQRASAAQGKSSVQAPKFEVDPLWPTPLPNHWLAGNVIGVGVDKDDHVYIIHRGAATLDRKEIYAAQNPPMSECCVAAPPVLVFDAAGNLVSSWGGPGQGFEWPDSNHGITPDSKGNVYIGGNGANDGQVLKFTKDGKFVKQFGFAYASAGSNDTWAFK